ncbi:MAG TPA: pentapeptide repeat-containing protein [Candidatus Acidoferrales bacterium]|nr:pentapeptide repeat-containing protein [Candidatus Acidoferrales bacterium]
MDDPANVENQDDSKKFTEIERKAIERALRSHSLEEIQKAVQIIAAVAEKRRELHGLEQEYSHDKKPHLSRFRRFLRSAADFFGPNLAAIVALATVGALFYQGYATRSTATSQARAQEDSQWHSAMEKIQPSGADGALVGAFEMQSFFSSTTYGPHARAVASTLLPEVQNKNGFDLVLFKLAGLACGVARPECTPNPALNAEIQQELLGVGRTIEDHERDLFEKVRVDDCVGKKCTGLTFRDFVQTPDKFFPDNNPYEDDLNLAWAYSWEVDSLSASLANLWEQPQKKIEPQGANLAGVVIESAELPGVDFSGANLSGTHFWNTNVTDADFTKVDSVDNSDWQGTHWWHAKAMSCPLVNYLWNGKFKPDESHPEAGELARKLLQNCQTVETH